MKWCIFIWDLIWKPASSTVQVLTKTCLNDIKIWMSLIWFTVDRVGSTPMGDSTDGVIFDKCDPVSV